MAGFDSSALPPAGSNESGSGFDDDPVVVGKFFSPAELFRKGAKPTSNQAANFYKIEDSNDSLEFPLSASRNDPTKLEVVGVAVKLSSGDNIVEAQSATTSV